MTSDKLLLNWSDFQDTVTTSFRKLQADADFSDVTLVCEDGHQVEAHRVILASCSPFFDTVLRRNTHPHPLIYMRGLKVEDLEAVVNFIYQGEVSVNQSDLEGFLKVAAELKLKGLTSQNKETNVPEKNREPRSENNLLRLKPLESLAEENTFPKRASVPDIDRSIFDFPIPSSNTDDIEIVEEDTTEEISLVPKGFSISSKLNVEPKQIEGITLVPKKSNTPSNQNVSIKNPTTRLQDKVTCPNCSKRGIHKLLLSSHMSTCKW